MTQEKTATKFWMLKSLPTRPTFMQDMTEEERAIMHQHIAYWSQKANEGMIVVFGPVFDPSGGYGAGVARTDSEEQVASFIAEDPAVTAGLMETTYCPMGAVLPQN